MWLHSPRFATWGRQCTRSNRCDLPQEAEGALLKISGKRFQGYRFPFPSYCSLLNCLVLLVCHLRTPIAVTYGHLHAPGGSHYFSPIKEVQVYPLIILPLLSLLFGVKGNPILAILTSS